MTKTLTLRDANQTFARCIREVEAGEEIVITRNGTPVARLSPVSKRRARPSSRRHGNGWTL
jgi:prevent-host-death family protein